MAKILLIDPDPGMLFALDQLLALRGHAFAVAAGSVAALRHALSELTVSRGYDQPVQ